MAKVLPGRLAQELDGGVGRGGRVALAAHRRLDDAHSGQREAALHERLLRRAAGDDQDAAAMAHLEPAQVGGQPPQVPLEHVHEQRPVAALQGELAELQQDAGLSAQTLHHVWRIYSSS